MSSLLSAENPFFKGVNKIFAFIQLSALWVVFSLPIFTMGAATTALYYSTNKFLRHNRDYVWSAFWTSFKRNFKQSTLIWIVFIVIEGIFIFDASILYYYAQDGMVFGNFYVIFIVLFVLCLVYSFWVFIYIARFNDKTKTILKNCSIMYLKHFSVTFILILIVTIGGFLIWFIPVFMFIVPSLGAFLLSFRVEKVFKKYMSKEDIELEEELNKNENI